MSEIFKTQVTIKFHQADPAGIMYFAHVFTLAHDAFEAFVQSCGFDWKDWFTSPKVATPIRHTECDFLRPFRAGETYQIEAQVIDFSTSTFVMNYQFTKDSKKHAVVQMVHTALNIETFQKCNLPDEIQQKLSKYHRKPQND